jgi:DNA polymerase
MLNALTTKELGRSARQHLDSLRAAGIEWLPLAAPPPELVESSNSIAESKMSVPIQAAGPTGLFAVETVNPSAGIEERRQSLQVLKAETARCTRCPELAATRTQTVFGVGKMDPDLCFIGEAPGADEDAQGEPFVGAAGQLLNRIIAACGVKREEVYICNILRCRPPGNRTPLPNEAANCRDFLDRTLELIRPKYICCLGACAAQNLLHSTLSATKLRGRIHDYQGIPVLVTYHPSYLLRNPSAKRDVWEDMKMLLTRMGKPIPGR